MLDKSLPYVEFVMERENPLPLPEMTLAEGYRLVNYQPGDGAAWCRIETAVGEFAEETEARTYFDKTFAPYPAELAKRMFFVETVAGEKVATCTAWWDKHTHGPLLHWLAVVPEHQRRGLAGFLTWQVTKTLESLYPHQPLQLHTQTWSHPAIKLYQRFGYQLVPGTPDYEKGLAILAALDEEK